MILLLDYGKGRPLTERINHPAHYGGADNPYEAIKVIEAWRLNFSCGNALKYIIRAGKKDVAWGDALANAREDIRKAIWYLERQYRGLQDGYPAAWTSDCVETWQGPAGYSVEEVIVGCHLNPVLMEVLRTIQLQVAVSRYDISISELNLYLKGLK